MKRFHERSRKRLSFKEQVAPATDSETAHPLLKLQRSAGNRAVASLVASEETENPSVQLKADAGHTDSQLEQQADRIADHLTACDSAPTSDSVAASDQSGSVQGSMEAALGIEPGSVQVHTGPRAENAARGLNARAFAIGNDVVFGANEYSPGTGEGRHLLAHELAHVAQEQQGSQIGSTLQRKVKIPSAEELENEIATLRIRLAELIQQETTEGKSLAERATVEHRLSWLEGVASEKDPNKQKIIYLRERIRQLRDEIKAAPPSSAKEAIAVNIQEHEHDLTEALEANVVRIESQLADLYVTVDLTPAISTQIQALENELRENEAELKILRRIFAPAKAETVKQTYKKEVRPDMSGHCMGAVYKGMEAIYSPKVSGEIEAQVRKDSREILKKTKKDTNNVDRIMETLREHSLAGEKVSVNYSQSKKVWEPTVEKTVLDMVSADYPGWYFFGLAVSGGWHSVILAVDNSEGSPKIYWMDQYSKGFTNDVTGKLDKKMKEGWLQPTYGFTDSRVWPLLPMADAVVEVK